MASAFLNLSDRRGGHVSVCLATGVEYILLSWRTRRHGSCRDRGRVVFDSAVLSDGIYLWPKGIKAAPQCYEVGYATIGSCVPGSNGSLLTWRSDGVLIVSAQNTNISLLDRLKVQHSKGMKKMAHFPIFS